LGGEIGGHRVLLVGLAQVRAQHLAREVRQGLAQELLILAQAEVDHRVLPPRAAGFAPRVRGVASQSASCSTSVSRTARRSICWGSWECWFSAPMLPPASLA